MDCLFFFFFDDSFRTGKGWGTGSGLEALDDLTLGSLAASSLADFSGLAGVGSSFLRLCALVSS